MTQSLSFVLPAFNEAENIASAVQRCVDVGQTLDVPFEVIVVDDGSRDATRSVLCSLTEANGAVRSIHHPQNRGYGAALRTGLLAARMDRVFFTDADLQFDVAEIALLLRHSDRFGIVAGYRHPRRDPIARRLLGYGWSRLVGVLFDLNVRDVDCAFKVFDRRIFDRFDLRSVGALVNTEILVRARADGERILQVPVTHFPRVSGQQTGASPRVVIKALRELAELHSDLHAETQRARLRGFTRA
ncbi:MAG: glycosyltransferase involved in cell wall biosynthesis [Myxococcota bacterium]